MNRRSFFQTTTATAFATQLSFSALAAATKGKSAEELATDEDFWMAIRNEFTTDRTVINMNNGYASPAPRTVQDAMKRYLDFTNMGPYHTMVMQLDPKIGRARRMVEEAAGGDLEQLVITRNSSEALEIAQLGVTLKPGDEVLTTKQDYPRMPTTFRQSVRRNAIKLRGISFPVTVVSMDDLYHRFVCHITNRTDQIFPVRRIFDTAHERGVPVIEDGRTRRRISTRFVRRSRSTRTSTSSVRPRSYAT